MDDRPGTYIAGTGTMTAVGGDSTMNFFMVRAGINRYSSVDYFTQRRERMSMALVPADALPPLLDELNVRGKIPFRYRRILRMCHATAEQAMVDYSGKAPVPLIFSAPANDVGLSEQFPEQFIHYLIQQSGLPIDPGSSRLIRTGRTGVLEALDLAFRYLYEAGAEYVLIGGGDSYQNSELLAALDKEDRIHAPGVMNGFAPGEGAGFILLTKNPAAAQRTKTHIPCLLSPGLAHEPGHLFSNEPYQGDGLAQAFRLALANAGTPDPIGTVYSSMNGENYWAKEYSVAMTRNHNHFTADCAIQHPAENYGDLGAATGAVLINLAVQAILNGHLTTPSLIYCSSDHMYRAAVCLESIPLTAFQRRPQPQHTPPAPGSIYGRKSQP